MPSSVDKARYVKYALVALVIQTGAGCAWLPTRTVIEVVTPPSHLMAACVEPPGDARTNREMAEWLLRTKIALRGCDARMEALREWATDSGDGP
jgi:hypothetical protein